MSLTVLQSVKQPTARTNPYVIQLVAALREQQVTVHWFSWRTALLGHYDGLHLHWPEVMVRRDGRPQRWAAMLRFLLLMLRLSLQRRIAVVRTLHNIGAHEPGSRVEGILLRWCDRRTDHWIALNDETPAPPGGRLTVILHGDYRAWYEHQVIPPPVPGRALYFGLIRPYKGVDALVAAFAGRDPADGTSLRIVGRPVSKPLTDLVEAACRDDVGISAMLEYVDDETLATEIGLAQLVVLPYRDMHNSGALLLALSLGRPALVPATPVTTALAREVGEEWVLTYAGELTPTVLATALATTATPPAGQPDLSRRTWKVIAAQHADLYRSLTRSS